MTVSAGSEKIGRNNNVKAQITKSLKPINANQQAVAKDTTKACKIFKPDILQWQHLLDIALGRLILMRCTVDQHWTRNIVQWHAAKWRVAHTG
jgi:hypothetical protein